jgi:hypothetical protein
VQQTRPRAGVELDAADSIGAERLVPCGTDAGRITDDGSTPAAILALMLVKFIVAGE